MHLRICRCVCYDCDSKTAFSVSILYGATARERLTEVTWYDGEAVAVQKWQSPDSNTIADRRDQLSLRLCSRDLETRGGVLEASGR